MSRDPDQQYFSYGITEDIITTLSRSPWLFVISPNSSFAYRGKMVDVRQVDRLDIATWDLLARGWKLFYELTKESLAEAETLFRKAVASTPISCEAHHLLASTIIHRAVIGNAAHKKAAISESYELAKRAILLDERNEYAHWSLG